MRNIISPSTPMHAVALADGINTAAPVALERVRACRARFREEFLHV